MNKDLKKALIVSASALMILSTTGGVIESNKRSINADAFTRTMDEVTEPTVKAVDEQNTDEVLTQSRMSSQLAQYFKKVKDPVYESHKSEINYDIIHSPKNTTAQEILNGRFNHKMKPKQTNKVLKAHKSVFKHVIHRKSVRYRINNLQKQLRNLKHQIRITRMHRYHSHRGKRYAKRHLNKLRRQYRNVQAQLKKLTTKPARKYRTKKHVRRYAKHYNRKNKRQFKHAQRRNAKNHRYYRK